MHRELTDILNDAFVQEGVTDVPTVISHHPVIPPQIPLPQSPEIQEHFLPQSLGTETFVPSRVTSISSKQFICSVTYE
jgi:hypothetical protein